MNAISNLPTTLKDTAQTVIANMTPLPKTYQAALFEKKDATFAPKDLPLKTPSAGEVLVKTIACGVCHSDAGAQAGAFGNGFPIVPGHEVIGNIAVVGDGEKRWKVGDRIGGPWHGGHDAVCKQYPAWTIPDVSAGRDQLSHKGGWICGICNVAIGSCGQGPYER